MAFRLEGKDQMLNRRHRRAVAMILALGSAGAALAADVGGGERIGVDPAQGRVGTRFTITCVDFPEPATSDMVYIVPAGTPDINPNAASAGQPRILWKSYASSCYANGGNFYEKAGPFAPGSYEVRYATTLYNNDNRFEISTRTAFMVR